MITKEYTNEIFACHGKGEGNYSLDNYESALEDAQIETDRIIY